MKAKKTNIESTSSQDLDTVVDEAIRAVCAQFLESVEGLAPESRSLIEEFFQGKDLESISEARGVTPAETAAWIENIKRELGQKLRQRNQIRQ